jgi:hypothetical protein
MSKKVLVFAAIVLLAGACSKTDTVQNKQDTAPVANKEQAAAGQSSFKELLASGKTQKCETSFATPNGNYSGTVYFAPEKMSGDFTFQIMGKTKESHMVIKDQTVYTWLDVMGTTMGFKMPVSASSTEVSSSGGSAANINQKISYDCQSWAEDDSVFALPQGLAFKEVGSKSSSSSASGSSTTLQKCSDCNKIPAANAKALCLAKYNCK